jgi:hypothetical protein
MGLLARLVLVAAVAAMSTTALGIEVQNRFFEVTFNEGGQKQAIRDTTVPYLPGNACYSWYLQLAEKGTPVTLVEQMRLPEAIDWGDVGKDRSDPTQIEENGQTAVTTLPLTSDADGWVSHGWCVAEGDPLGEHMITVKQGEEIFAAFDYVVVPAESYIPPHSWAVRSGTSW